MLVFLENLLNPRLVGRSSSSGIYSSLLLGAVVVCVLYNNLLIKRELTLLSSL